MMLTLLIATTMIARMMTVMMMATILDPDLGARTLRLLRCLNNVEDLALLRSNAPPIIGHSRCASIVNWLL